MKLEVDNNMEKRYLGFLFVALAIFTPTAIPKKFTGLLLFFIIYL